MKHPAGRVVALSNGTLAFLMVAVLGGIALVVDPPAPPGISEFAPKASKPITKAPQDQWGGADSRPAACAGTASCSPSGRPSASPGSSGTPTPKQAGVAGTRQCYAWPDGSVTQTFDPQSPPCIASWDSKKGNGGATTKGVTASEILVTVPGGAITSIQRDTVDFFNSHFMLYDRKIRLVPVDTSGAYTGSQSDPSPSGFKAVARRVLALKPFASLTGTLEPKVAPFVEELARGHVISVAGDVTELTSTAQARMAPYSWGYQPGLDVVQRNLAAFTCSALVGRRAVHGGADVAGEARKFAVLLRDQDTFDAKPLLDGLAACNSPARVVRIRTHTSPGDPATTAQFLQLRDDGYTTLITYTHGWSISEAQYASTVGYTPEWLLAGTRRQAAEGNFVFPENRRQLANAFGFGTWNRLLPWSSEPWYQVAIANGRQLQPGQIDQLEGHAFYHSLLLLASGIQTAGPELTTETFAEGLHTTSFSNPGAGGPRYWQAAVGFGQGFGMVRDIGLVWWNQSAREYTGSPTGAQIGGWCYIDNGRRFQEGTWPTSDPEMPKRGPCT